MLFELCSASSSFFSNSSTCDAEDDDDDDDEVLEVVSLLESSLGGGPGGGPPAPPAPPGPPEKALANTFFSSLAWSEVSLPLSTSLWIRSSIFDCISSGDGGLLALVDEDELLLPPFKAESMSSSADDSAVWSVELTLPA